MIRPLNWVIDARRRSCLIKATQSMYRVQCSGPAKERTKRFVSLIFIFLYRGGFKGSKSLLSTRVRKAGHTYHEAQPQSYHEDTRCLLRCISFCLPTFLFAWFFRLAAQILGLNT